MADPVKLTGFTERNGEPVEILLEDYCPQCTESFSAAGERFEGCLKEAYKHMRCKNCLDARVVLNGNGRQLLQFASRGYCL